MLSNICRAALRSLDRHWASADFSRRSSSVVPAHSLEPLEGRVLCSATASIPVVSITVVHPDATKPGETTTFIVRRTGSRKEPLTVDYTTVDMADVEAIAGVDYQALPGSVTILKGHSAVKFKLVPLTSDDPDQGARAVDLEILPSDTYTTAPQKLFAAATIASPGRVPWVSITASTDLLPGPTVITEGVRPGIMAIRLSTNLATTDSMIGFTVSGTAPSSRYTLNTSDDGGVTLVPLDSNTFMFHAGDATAFAIYIDAPDDGIAEPAQTVTLTLVGADGCNISPTGASATLKIQDMNSKPIVDTKKWPIVPVAAAAGSSSKFVDVFPLNVTIINKGPTPTGLFDVALYAVDPAHPYDPNYQNYFGTLHYVGLDPTDYPTNGLESGQEEQESLAEGDEADNVAPGIYKLMIVVNPTLDQVTNGISAAAANVFLDPTQFYIVIKPLPNTPGNASSPVTTS